MTRQEFLEFHDDFTHEMYKISEKKNADYAGHGSSAFTNFELIERMGFLTTEQGFITRITDKISRIMTFIKNGELQVKDESVKDTLLDMANYCVLLAGYIESKKAVEDLPNAVGTGGKIDSYNHTVKAGDKLEIYCNGEKIGEAETVTFAFDAEATENDFK